jgi:hypothetical protein
MRERLEIRDIEYNKCKDKIKDKFNSLGITDEIYNKIVFRSCKAIKNNYFVVCLKFKVKGTIPSLSDEVKKIIGAHLVIVIINNAHKNDFSDMHMHLIHDYKDFIVFINGLIEVLKAIFNPVYKHFDEGKIDKYLHQLMASFKINPKMSGYGYFVECVKIFLNTSEKLLLKDVYEMVAFKFHKSVENIEKSIRSAIKQSVQNYPELYKCGCRTEKITTFYLINYMINNITTEICCREPVRFYNKIFA